MAELSLGVKIWGDINELLTATKKAEKEIERFGKRVGKLGKEMAESFTLPIIGMGVIAVKNFGDSEKAASSLASQIRSSGKDVESTMKKYEAFAAQMQNLTTVDDDAVIGLLQLAEGMQAPDPQKAAKDAIALSKAYGVDLENGVSLATKAQLGQYQLMGRMFPAIKAAKTETEKAAIANQIFASSWAVAQTQAQAGLGPLEQLKNELDNTTEEFGKLISQAIMPFVRNVKDAIVWIQSLDEGTKKWIVGIALGVAAFGPLLMAVSKMISGMIALKGALSLVLGGFTSVGAFVAANPWVLVAAAAAAAAAAMGYYGAKVTMGMDKTEAFANALNKQAQALDENVNYFQKLGEEAGGGEAQKKYLETLRGKAEYWTKQANKAKKDGNDSLYLKMSVQADKYYEVIQKIEKSQAKVNSGFKLPATEEDKGVIARLNEEIGKLEIRLTNEIAANDKNATTTARLIAQKQKLVETYKAEAEQLKILNTLAPTTPGEAPAIDPREKLPTVDKIAGKDIYNSPTVTIPGQNVPKAPEEAGGLSRTATKLKEMGSIFDTISGKLGGIYSQFNGVFKGISDVVEGAAKKTKDGWMQAFGGIAEAAFSVMNMIGSISSQIFSNRKAELDTYYDNEKERIEGSSISEEEKQKRMQKLDKETAKKRKELAREEAKTQKALALVNAIIAGALGVVQSLAYGGPVGIALAVITAALAAVEIATIASTPLPALAGGGLAMAPTMALVGDNANARIDPEVIAPLSKLKEYMGGGDGSTQLKAVVRGDDLLFIVDRAGINRTRTTGR